MCMANTWVNTADNWCNWSHKKVEKSLSVIQEKNDGLLFFFLEVMVNLVRSVLNDQTLSLKKKKYLRILCLDNKWHNNL